MDWISFFGRYPQFVYLLRFCWFGSSSRNLPLRVEMQKKKTILPLEINF